MQRGNYNTSKNSRAPFNPKKGTLVLLIPEHTQTPESSKALCPTDTLCASFGISRATTRKDRCFWLSVQLQFAPVYNYLEFRAAEIKRGHSLANTTQMPAAESGRFNYSFWILLNF